MSQPSLSAVILLPTLEGALQRTLASVRRQRPSFVDVTVVATQQTARVAPLLIGAHERLVCVEGEGAGPSARLGAFRNAGLAAAAGEGVVFLLGGEALLDGYTAALGAKLAEPEVALVAPWVRERYDFAETRVRAIGSSAIAALLSQPQLIDGGVLLRRAAVLAAGPYDEALDALEEWDMTLRLVGAGGRLALVDEPLVEQPVSPRSARRRALTSTVHATAHPAVCARHAALFQAHIAEVAAAQQLRHHELLLEHREQVAKRDRVLSRTQALEAEFDAAQRELVALGGLLEFGDLRRVSPLSRDWGYDRGGPVDRWYIERFLEQHASDIRGRVLEIQEPDYTTRFGGDRVEQADVLDVDPGNPLATVIADLRRAPHLADDTFDCFILTQTLHVIDDPRAALREALRILKPGGVLLASFPAASRTCTEYGPEGDFWRMTPAGARQLFDGLLPESHLELEPVGNVLTTTSFLYGLGKQELTEAEYRVTDPQNPMMVMVRAQKPGHSTSLVVNGLRAPPTGSRRANSSEQGNRAAVLLYHRVGSARSDVHGLCLSPAAFRQQLEVLKRHFFPMSLQALTAALEAGRVPPGAVALTFDDGALDNLEQASPLLVEAGVPATFFVTGEGWHGAHEFWWDALERALLGGGPRPASLPPELADGRLLATATTAQREAAHRALYPLLYALTPEGRDERVAALLRWSGVPAPTVGHRPLEAAELRRLAARPGHELGAHGARHLPARSLTEARAETEIVQHRAQLEALLGKPVTSFAYPFGELSPVASAAVARAGFSRAVTCDARAACASDDLLHLPRLEPKETDTATFREWLERHLGRTRLT